HSNSPVSIPSRSASLIASKSRIIVERSESHAEQFLSSRPGSSKSSATRSQESQVPVTSASTEFISRGKCSHSRSQFNSSQLSSGEISGQGCSTYEPATHERARSSGRPPPSGRTKEVAGDLRFFA